MWWSVSVAVHTKELALDIKRMMDLKESAARWRSEPVSCVMRSAVGSWQREQWCVLHMETKIECCCTLCYTHLVLCKTTKRQVWDSCLLHSIPRAVCAVCPAMLSMAQDLFSNVSQKFGLIYFIWKKTERKKWNSEVCFCSKSKITAGKVQLAVISKAQISCPNDSLYFHVT